MEHCNKLDNCWSGFLDTVFEAVGFGLGIIGFLFLLLIAYILFEKLYKFLNG
jgi:hypothetical protein